MKVFAALILASAVSALPNSYNYQAAAPAAAPAPAPPSYQQVAPVAVPEPAPAPSYQAPAPVVEPPKYDQASPVDHGSYHKDNDQVDVKPIAAPADKYAAPTATDVAPVATNSADATPTPSPCPKKDGNSTEVLPEVTPSYNGTAPANQTAKHSYDMASLTSDASKMAGLTLVALIAPLLF